MGIDVPGLISTAFFYRPLYNPIMVQTFAISEAEILEHVVSPITGDLTPEASRAILELKFDAAATKRIRQLLKKNNRGSITAEERIALERFLRVGKFIDLLQAKARVSLKKAEQPS
jgi:hypothetical protein